MPWRQFAPTRRSECEHQQPSLCLRTSSAPNPGKSSCSFRAFCPPLFDHVECEASGQAARCITLARELLGDSVDDARVGGFDVRREDRDDVTAAANQIFVKIPSRSFERALSRGPSIERVWTFSFHVCFSRQWKCDAVVRMSSVDDL